MGPLVPHFRVVKLVKTRKVMMGPSLLHQNGAFVCRRRPKGGALCNALCLLFPLNGQYPLVSKKVFTFISIFRYKRFIFIFSCTHLCPCPVVSSFLCVGDLRFLSAHNINAFASVHFNENKTLVQNVIDAVKSFPLRLYVFISDCNILFQTHTKLGTINVLLRFSD